MTAVRREPHPDSPNPPELDDAPVSLGDRVGGACRAIQDWWNEQFSAPVRNGSGSRLWLSVGVLLSIAAVLLIPDNRPLLDPDEGRHAEIARSILARGDWLVPHLHDIPYFEKPPLQHWLTAAMFQLFGTEPWVARSVPAMAAWLTVLLTFVWARVALGTRVAFLGSMCLCLSLEFVVLGRTVILDALLTLFVASSWFTAYLAISSERFRWRWWLVSAAACGLGILTKGPVCLVLVLPPVLVCAWLMRLPVHWKANLCFATVALLVAASWYVAMACKEPNYVGQFFWKAHVLRYLQPFDHQEPWWFYVPVLVIGTLPWSLLWPAVCVFLISRKPGFPTRRAPALGCAVMLAAWPVLFFSLAGCKSAPYMLPVLVPMALISGACLDAVLFMPGARRYWLFSYCRKALPCHAAMAVLLLGSLTYCVAVWFQWMRFTDAIIGVLLGPCLAIGVWFTKGRVQPPVAWSLCAAGCLAYGLFPSRDVYSAFVQHRSPVALVRHIKANSERNNGHRFLSADRAWFSASFALGGTVTAFGTDVLEQQISAEPDAGTQTWIFVRNDDRLDALVARLQELAIRPDVHRLTPTAHLALVSFRAHHTSTTSPDSAGSMSRSVRRGFSEHRKRPNP